jgi:hypothetical protein
VGGRREYNGGDLAAGGLAADEQRLGKIVPCSLSLSRRVPRRVGPYSQHHRCGRGPGLLGPVRLRNLFSFLFLFLDLMQRFKNPNPYLEF